MIVFPAIDLVGGKAVRLYKGDYTQMTVYSLDPVSVAKDMEAQGARYIHLVDLEGARDGGTPNLPVAERIAKETGLFTEIGGGARPGHPRHHSGGERRTAAHRSRALG